MVSLKAKEEAYHTKQQFAPDKRNCAKEISEFQGRNKVWVQDQDGIDGMGKVLTSYASPRSYIVETEKGSQIKRNRSVLVLLNTWNTSNQWRCSRTPPPTLPPAEKQDAATVQRPEVPTRSGISLKNKATL